MRTLATLTFINLIRLSVIIFLLMVGEGRWVPDRGEKKIDFKWLIQVMYLEIHDSSMVFAYLATHFQPGQLNF